MDTNVSENTFNPIAPTIMHLDLNSCFATIEQQANPLLRGKAVAVAAYTTGNGCIVAPSIEAKRFGVKTGMRVRDGQTLCPGLIIVPPDPWKYRFVNRKLLALLQEYSADVEVRSIDEMVLPLAHSRVLARHISTTKSRHGEILSQEIVGVIMSTAKEIKCRIRAEIGEWLMVSIGIAPNRYLAKIASMLHKPDGLDVITKENIEKIFSKLQLEDLCGIKRGNAGRLRRFGITTVIDFYRATPKKLQAAFHSIVGYHWWMRLHGWEIDPSTLRQVADHREFDRKSFGHSYALYKPYTPKDVPLHQILSQLVEKMGRRLRAGGYTTQGIHVSLLFADFTYWHHGEKVPTPLFATSDLYTKARRVLTQAPDKPVRILSVSCFHLNQNLYEQESLFEEEQRKRKLTQALDVIADRWGDFTVTSGRMLAMQQKVLDRIAFGGVAGLEEFVFREQIERDPNEFNEG